MKPDYETVEFTDVAAFRAWMDTHHTTVPGIWLRIYKKGSGIATVTNAESLDTALCYGWIDGQRNALDKVSFLQKYTPRRPRSLWSKRNIEYIERLTKAGLMMPAGMAEVERAKADGRWDAAYDRQRDMKVPDYFLKELKKYPKAEAFYATLNKSNLFAIAWRLQTVKTDKGRTQRMAKIIESLNSEQKLY